MPSGAAFASGSAPDPSTPAVAVRASPSAWLAAFAASASRLVTYVAGAAARE
jgi:hypothetical protein